MIKRKRVYDQPEESDGTRILVDHLWPRGLRKEKAGIHSWMREIAPSDELRRWFSHKKGRWAIFKRRYEEELREKKALMEEIRRLARTSAVTLLYAARDESRNNAVVLEEFLRKDSRRKK